MATRKTFKTHLKEASQEYPGEAAFEIPTPETTMETITPEAATETVVATTAQEPGATETVVATTAQEPGATTPMEAIKEDASPTREAAAEFLPSLGKTLSKAIYQGCYYVSYGVVFSALIVTKLVPMDNVMGQGLGDGADAAKKAFDKRQEEKTADFGTTENLAAA